MKKKEFLEVKNELLEVENEADLRDLLLLVPEKYGIGHITYFPRLKTAVPNKI